MTVPPYLATSYAPQASPQPLAEPTRRRLPRRRRSYHLPVAVVLSLVDVVAFMGVLPIGLVLAVPAAIVAAFSASRGDDLVVTWCRGAVVYTVTLVVGMAAMFVIFALAFSAMSM